MSQANSRLTELLDGYMAGQLTQTQENDLFEIVSEITEEELSSLLLPLLESTHSVSNAQRSQRIWLAVKAGMAPQVNVRRMWKRRAMAASVVGIMLLGGYWYKQSHKEKSPGMVPAAITGNLKAPQANRATVTLMDGTTVYLDSMQNGQLAVQGNVKLVKLADGRIAYEQADVAGHTEIKYNTLTNPKGSKVIDMLLADGSRVWLNAGSSVTYPVVFAGSERKVMMEGEAYFEIAKDASKKFVVQAGGITTEVLGTHFNVNAYADEPGLKVTLLEGLVRITQKAESRMLRPGQQIVSTDNALTVNTNVDVEVVMAWKNGYFQLNGAGITEIMRQVARWYDVEVVYEGTIPGWQFGGQIDRNADLPDLLAVLKKSKVNGRLEGRKLLVTAASR